MTETVTFAPRAVAQVVDMPYHVFAGDSGARILRGAKPELMDPFLGVDGFVMSQPVFAAHPHAGMSAVTLMLPEAQGGFVNRDSLGDTSEINPGDLHWTQAASGMVHDEYPQVNGVVSIGLQVFVNLSKAHKRAAPAALKVRAADMPNVTVAGEGGSARVRVVAGELGGEVSPITGDARWLNRVNMLDISLDADAEVSLPITGGHNAFFVLNSGALVVEGRALTATSALTHAVFFSRDGSHVQLRGGESPVRGVLFTGMPLGEPVYQHGPFTGNTAEDIAGYMRRYQSGDMGRLSDRSADI